MTGLSPRARLRGRLEVPYRWDERAAKRRKGHKSGIRVEEERERGRYGEGMGSLQQATRAKSLAALRSVTESTPFPAREAFQPEEAKPGEAGRKRDAPRTSPLSCSGFWVVRL